MPSERALSPAWDDPRSDVRNATVRPDIRHTLTFRRSEMCQNGRASEKSRVLRHLVFPGEVFCRFDRPLDMMRSIDQDRNFSYVVCNKH